MNDFYQPFDRFTALYKESTPALSSSHFHNVYEITYIAKGARRFFQRDTAFDVTEGSMALFPPFTYHSTKGDVPVTCYVLYFSRELLLRCFNELTTDMLLSCFNRCKFTCPPASAAPGIVVEIYEDYLSGDVTKAVMNLGRLLTMLRDADGKHGSDAPDPLLENVVRYIGNNLTTVKHIEQIANFACTSPSHLSAVFKRATGVTLMQFVISLRVSTAASELIYTDKKIEQIAFDCGFESANYFSNTFRRLIGVSPSVYRKTNAVK